MDLKKLPKSLGFSEQFSSKSKVFSGFGLGVIASVLLLTVLFLNHPLKASLLYPVFQGFNGIKSPLHSWPFSGLGNVTNSTHGVGGSRNTSLSSNDVGLGLNQTHGGVSSEFGKNSSFIDSRDGKLVPGNTQSGNSSEIEKKSGFVNSTGGNLDSERTQSGNLSHSEAERSPHQGNLSNSTKSLGVGAKTDNNGTMIGNSVDKGIGKNNGGNASSGENVRSNGTKGSVSEKTQEQNSTKELKVSSSSSDTSRVVGDFKKCDIFDGRWVRDEGKPYYPAGSCPYIDRDFDCYLNGRPDDGFVKWRWQPNHCNIPSLNATDFLERLRGKRLVFVGDSLNRNMWESLVCILRHSVANKKKVYEISGKKEFKKKGFYAFHYEDFNCSVDFVSSPFLVRETSVKKKNSLMETLRLDLMDKTASMYHDADVIVFNTGHWWTHEKTSKGENYYQEGNHVYLTLKVLDAFKKALTTWARWVDNNVDAHKSQVFFRGYSVTHFRGGQWNSGGQCHKETEPIYNDTFLAKYPSKMRALEPVLRKMKTPVAYLNISKLTDYRKDAHPSIYRKEYKTAEEKHAAESSQDCSHWCLPGIPDTWNELLYASLLKEGRGSWGN